MRGRRAWNMTPKSQLSAAISVALFGMMSNGAAFGQASAPNATPQELEEVVVSGIRESLTQALDIKRESIQIVDAVVAEDIGKFPDNNTVEALQRVPGVQVTDRARGEVSRVAIRGLEDVTTTINGRNIFTASGRQVALADIPSSLLNRVDIYKTRSADLIEQGIAGVIDIVAHRPFNFDDSKISLSARGVYEEQNDEIDPHLSALLSDRWETGIGQLGALLNVSYAKTHYRDQSVTAGAMVPFLTGTNLPPVPAALRADYRGNPNDMNNWVPYERIFTTNPRVATNPTTPGAVHTPVQIWQPGMLDGLPTAAGSTLNFNGAQYPYVLSRDAVFASDLTGTRERPAANLSLQFAPNDSSEYTFEAFYNGYRDERFNSLLFTFVDWWGAPSNTVLYPGTNIVKSRDIRDPYGFMSGDLLTGDTDSYLYSIGGKWEITDAFEMTADVYYQDSRYDETFFAMRTERVAPSVSVDFNAGDGITAFSFGDNPATANINESNLTDARLWNVAQLYDNALWREGDSMTADVDGSFKTDWTFIEKLSFGVRYDDRSASEGARTQTSDGQRILGTNSTTNGVLGINLATHPELVSTNSGFFDGQSAVPTTWAVADGYYIRSHADEVRSLYNRTLNIDLATSNELVIPKNFEVQEVTTAAYVQADFNADIAGHAFDGQFGARYVNVDTDMDFFSGPVNARVRSSASESKSKVLPSVMARFAITDDLRVRASYGETLRRPNFVDLNANITYTRDVTNIGYGTATGGNPNLDPVESKNYDLSLEWYFSDSSAVYATLFKREIEGLIVPFFNVVQYTDSVGPYTYVLAQPDNASNGELEGFELGFQYFPDNVPNWLKGIGIQASATWLDSSQDTPTTNSAGAVTGVVTSDMFGVSEKSYSAVLVYEKWIVDARLSWVWRDDFLNHYEAALFANPREVWRASEQNLDFQLSFDVTDALVLTLDARNLTDEIYQSYYVNPNTNNFGSVITGRTFAFGARYTF